MATRSKKLTQKDFATDQDVRWCPGCGDYSILANVQRVMPEFGDSARELRLRLGHRLLESLPLLHEHLRDAHHPRPRTRLRDRDQASRPELSVWVVTGDGDGLSIGGNHLLHTIRRNIDLQILLFNNRVYGLTKGQYSPTSDAPA